MLLQKNALVWQGQLVIKCQFCSQQNVVETVAKHKTGKHGPSAYDINSRAALACLHTGIGQTHLNGVLSTMNIPTMSRACFKRREREAGCAVESVARATCQDVLDVEKNNAVSIGAKPDENDLFLFHAHMTWAGKNVAKASIPILVIVL